MLLVDGTCQSPIIGCRAGPSGHIPDIIPNHCALIMYCRPNDVTFAYVFKCVIVILETLTAACFTVYVDVCVTV